MSVAMEGRPSEPHRPDMVKGTTNADAGGADGSNRPKPHEEVWWIGGGIQFTHFIAIVV